MDFIINWFFSHLGTIVITTREIHERPINNFVDYYNNNWTGKKALIFLGLVWCVAEEDIMGSPSLCNFQIIHSKEILDLDI